MIAAANCESEPKINHPPRLLIAITDPSSTAILRGQLKYIRDSGFSVWFLCNPGDLVDKFAEAEGIASVTVPMHRQVNPFFDLVSVVRTVRVLRQIRPDIVNASTPKAGLIVLLAAWICRIKVRIFTLRGIRSVTLRGLPRFVVGLAEKFTCSLATQVLCISDGIKQTGLSLGYFGNVKAVVLGSGSSNGVDLTRFTPSFEKETQAKELRERIGIPDNSPVVGYVGRLVRDKGLVELIEVWQILKREYTPIHLLLIGEWETSNRIPEATKRVMLEDETVHIVPFMPDPSFAYLAMDLLVLPTYREGFGNVLLEANAMGIPVVASRVDGCVNAVEDGVSGKLVGCKSTNQLARAIRSYLDSPSLRREHGQSGRKRVEKLFRREVVWEAQLRNYLGLLDGIT